MGRETCHRGACAGVPLESATFGVDELVHREGDEERDCDGGRIAGQDP